MYLTTRKVVIQIRKFMKNQYILIITTIFCAPIAQYCRREEPTHTTSTTINDFSRLNKTNIHSLKTPSSYQELQEIVAYAKKNKLKIAIAGIRHSQGGHAFFTNAIVINLKKLNRILDFDPDKKLITVQAGTTWNTIQEFLHPHGCAVKIMQFANLFTIGGSLSVNCNGIDPNYGPLIESIQSIKILLENGSIVTASRSENSELFSLAIGGYGLFGIILQATIQVVKDDLYKKEITLMSLDEYVKKLKNMRPDQKTGFHFSFLTLTASGKKLFGQVANFDFKKIDDTKFSKKSNLQKRILHHEKNINRKKIVTKLWSKNKLIKALHWIPEVLRHSTIVSRNNIMRPPASHLYIEIPNETNLLQEYFIPIDNLIKFITSLEIITKKLNVNLMHVAFRFIPKNTESYLSYLETDRVGIVLFFNQKITADDNRKTQQWTQHLIKKAAQLNGAYYLPIQLHATKKQVLAVYPKLDRFFTLKREYDSSELFMNHFYAKYAH